jgi:FkbM family methyltransferase
MALEFKPKHIIDIGSNRGDWTRNARRMFDDALITMVEPQTNLNPFIRDLLADSRNRIYNVGIGPMDGEAIFTIHERDDSCSFAFSEETARARGFKQVPVKINCLDTLLAADSWPAPDIVKIDAEGYDIEVLKGAQSALTNCEVLFMEAAVLDATFTNTLSSVIAAASELGFRLFDFSEFVRTPERNLLWVVEAAFIRRNGILDRQVTYR